MRKIADPPNKGFDCAVRNSLTAIKETHVQLHLLTGKSATAALIASQIELYDVLLDEISGIHTSLASYLKHPRLTRQVSSRPSLHA